MIWMGLAMSLPLLGLILFFVLPLRTAVPLYLIVTGFSALYYRAMMRAMRLPVRSGRKTMIGSEAVVLRWEGKSGEVIWNDEIWQARTKDGGALANGDRVVIEKLSGLTLVVTRESSARQ